MMQDRTAAFFDEIAHNLFISIKARRFFDNTVGSYCCLDNHSEENYDLKFKRLLREYIYARFYSNDNQRADELIRGKEKITTIVDCEEPSLGRSLAAACHDCYVYDSGWSNDDNSKEGNNVFVNKFGVRLKAESADLVVTECGKYSLRMPAVRRFVLPGWTIVFGEIAPFDVSAGYGRHYFPARDTSTLVSMFGEIAHYMNEMRYPFQLKAINNSSRIERADNIVLFAPAELLLEELYPLYEKLSEKYSSGMKPPPPMTHCVEMGWGFAEEKPSNDFERLSFGQKRCGIIADALVKTNEDSSAKEKLARIKRAFAENGLSFDRPYEGRSKL